MSEPAGAQRRKIVLRPARPADVRNIYELVRPYAEDRKSTRLNSSHP